jgi:hypothetical protein
MRTLRRSSRLEPTMVVLNWLAGLPWSVVVMACLTLGLAPFAPPHVYEKLGMLFAGKLVRPIDWFDLFMHGAPWLVAIAKGVLTLTRVGGAGATG